jgi:hypothetical protein
MAIENLRYSVEVLPPDQRCVEAVVAPVEDLTAARVVFDLAVTQRPDKLVMLCQNAWVLRRSDRRD